MKKKNLFTSQSTLEHKVKRLLLKCDRRNFILFFFILFSLMIVWKMFVYTVMNYSFYRDLADKQQIWKVTVPVTRGTIYSGSNNPTIIWTSLNLYDIAIDPKKIWDKLKLTKFLTDIVYKELCYLKSKNSCYENTLKFLRLLEIENFTKDEAIIKKLIFTRLKKKIYQKRVTSVFVDIELDKNKLKKIKSFQYSGIYIRNSFLYINPEEIVNNDWVVDNISPILWLKKDRFRSLIKKRDLRYVQIINKISIHIWEEIKKYLFDENIARKKWMLDIKDSIWNFIIFTPKPHRFYPEKEVASQIIWFVDNAWVWHYWIEWYFNDILKGNNWKIVSRKDIQGRVIDPINLNKEDLVWEGIKIYTTIDRNIQSKVEEILELWAKTYQANKWTVVIMEPSTGKVISMANYPTYDINNHWDVYELEKVKYSKYPDPKIDLLGMPVFVEDTSKWKKYYYDSKEIFLREATKVEVGDIAQVKYKYKNDFWPFVYKNDAISSLYEPGSIMKAITVAIWIDTWDIWRYHMYMDKWEVVIDNFPIKNDSDKCLWYHSFEHALNHSCNIWMIRIAQRIGKVLMHQYFTDFGFSQKTGITLYWEVFSQIKPWERWSIAQLLTSSYGLWVSVTPLQMAQAYSVLANGGFYIKPSIIDSVSFPNGKTIEYKKELERRVIKKSTGDIITSMLYSSIENWVAKNGKVPWYSMAWKTGTSQIPYKWKYETWVWSTIASYAWYGPVQDPKFVIVVKLDRPRIHWGYWGRTAAFLFKEISEYLLDYYGIPKKG
jgi:stage V sporulation protein D (sporulation-specific penicillin-binding protein)